MIVLQVARGYGVAVIKLSGRPVAFCSNVVDSDNAEEYRQSQQWHMSY